MPVQMIFSRFALAELDLEGQKQVVLAPIYGCRKVAKFNKKYFCLVNGIF